MKMTREKNCNLLESEKKKKTKCLLDWFVGSCQVLARKYKIMARKLLIMGEQLGWMGLWNNRNGRLPFGNEKEVRVFFFEIQKAKNTPKSTYATLNVKDILSFQMVSLSWQKYTLQAAISVAVPSLMPESCYIVESMYCQYHYQNSQFHPVLFLYIGLVYLCLKLECFYKLIL